MTGCESRARARTAVRRAARAALAALMAAGMVVAPGFPAGAAGASSCAVPAPPAAPLRVEGFYGDAQHSVVDPARRAAHDAAVAPYEAFVRQIAEGADAYRGRGDAAAGRCALDRLAGWARAGALTQALAPGQAQYERNWYLASLALAYLKLKPLATSDDRAVVEGWLSAIAARTAAFVDGRARPGNNLLYWAGLALAASALATGDAGLEARADAILAEGLAAIRPDGTLPAEMARGGKALAYHAFAAEPLVALATIALARGKAPATDLAPLRALVGRVVAGVADPAFFVARAGAPQERPAEWSLAFLDLYAAMAPGVVLPPHGTRTHFLGGDVAGTLAAIREQAGGEGTTRRH
ncbi:alginate lyase family protein [Ancylobacter terrae]|uniref:alginate lyase family protein n=1 Tax=Ancylobacter sp. sgz301288 TaxID=3342077 RepID=UPI00385BB56B